MPNTTRRYELGIAIPIIGVLPTISEVVAMDVGVALRRHSSMGVDGYEMDYQASPFGSSVEDGCNGASGVNITTFEEIPNSGYAVTDLISRTEDIFKTPAFDGGSRYFGWRREAHVTVQIPPLEDSDKNSGAKSDE